MPGRSMTPGLWFGILCGAALSVLGASGPARASLFCEIRATKDGFAALRDGPGPNARLLQRMRPGDEVLLGQGRRGPWVEVTFWRGGRYVAGAPAGGVAPTAKGWMHSALLARDSCG